MERIPASERTREQLKAVIVGSSEGGGTSELVRLTAPTFPTYCASLA